MNGVARIPEPREWVLTRRCTECGETKAWAEFSPRKYWPDGSVRLVCSRCRRCDCERSAVRSRDYRRRNRERVRAYQREWDRRQAEQRSRERAARGGWLPVEPFRSWVLEVFEEFGDWVMTGSALRSSADTLRRVGGGKTRYVALDVVDRALTARGVHLSELYPEGFR